MKKVKRKIPESNWLFCDNPKCDKDIGYVSRMGRKYYDNGVINTGSLYVCSMECLKQFN